MNKEQIKHITDIHYSKLKDYNKHILKWPDAEAIHQFRVEYKKFRAFLRMITQHHVTRGKIKIARKLKENYKVSGSIRDLQLQQQHTLKATKQELKKPQAYLLLLQKEIDKLKHELFELILGDPVAESKKKTDASIPQEFRLIGFKLFIKRNLALINAIIISGHFNDDNIHTIRKKLKDLFYNLKEYSDLDYDLLFVSILRGENEKFIIKLLVELGRFQDKCTAITLLKSYWLNSLNKSNQELLLGIKKKWASDKVIMQKMLIKKLKTNLVLITNEKY